MNKLLNLCKSFIQVDFERGRKIVAAGKQNRGIYFVTHGSAAVVSSVPLQANQNAVMSMQSGEKSFLKMDDNPVPGYMRHLVVAVLGEGSIIAEGTGTLHVDCTAHKFRRAGNNTTIHNQVIFP